MKNNVKGITLIALVITIIILIILAGVSINLIGGSDGIITKSQRASNLWDMKSTLESIKLKALEDGKDIMYESKVVFTNRLTEAGKQTVLKYENEYTNANNSEIQNQYYEVKKDLYTSEDGSIYIYNDKDDYIVKLKKEEYYPLMAMWFWVAPHLENEYKYITNATERESVLTKLQQNNYNVIYLSMDYQHLENYTPFIESAHEKDMDVYALFGDPLFIYNDYSDGIYNYIDAIKTYNDTHDIKIKQIHYDVEPHTINRSNYPAIETEKCWVDCENEDSKKSLSRVKFIEFVQHATEYAHQNNIKIGYDITFWLDRYSYYDAATNTYKNMGEEVVKASDNVTIMDFGTTPTYIYANVTDKGTYSYSDGSTITVAKNWIEKCIENDTTLIVGMDLETFEREATKKQNAYENDMAEYNILVPTYIPADYVYTRDYVNNNIIKASQDLITNYQKDNNYMGLDIGYAIHHTYSWLRLLDK